MSKKVNTATLLVLLSASLALAQTNATRPSTVGVWKLDVEQSKFVTEPAPKSATLTILKDTPDEVAWRYEAVDAAGKPVTFSWSGPPDGSMQDLTGGDGQVLKESLKRDGDVVLRHLEVPDVGTFDARGTFSADGNTFTDLVTMKSKDGKTATNTEVYRRDVGAKPAGK